MSYTIDLTSESPPRSNLTLPVGNDTRPSASSNRAATSASTSASSSRLFDASSDQHPSNSRLARRLAVHGTSDPRASSSTASARQSTSAAAGSSSSRVGTSSSSNAAAGPSSSRWPSSNNNPPRRRTSATAGSHDSDDDGFELVGVSEGARQVVDMVREGMRQSRSHTSASASRSGPDPGSGISATTASSSSTTSRARQRINTGTTRSHRSLGTGMPRHVAGPSRVGQGIVFHDGLPPGPHHTNPTPAAQNHHGQLAGPSGAPRAYNATTLLSQMGDITPEAMLGLIYGMRAPRSAPGLPVAEKHDVKYVLNFDKPVKSGFSFGIIEPPVDVETFEEDPRLIRGPLPDTSAICAGCDRALVLGASDERRMWALPCGHVVDGRCYHRYCQGLSPKVVRELGKQDVEAEIVAAAKLAETTAGSPQQRKIDDLLPGVKRSGANDNEEATPSKRAKRSSKSKGKAKDDSSLEVDNEEADSTKDTTKKTAMAKLAPSVKTFKCPVDGCVQRITTTSGKASSAIELYV